MYDRFLIARGEGEKTYVIRREGVNVAQFTTAGVNGKTADETAIGNLADFSEHQEEGTLVLIRGTTLIASAEFGLYRTPAMDDAETR